MSINSRALDFSANVGRSQSLDHFHLNNVAVRQCLWIQTLDVLYTLRRLPGTWEWSIAAQDGEWRPCTPQGSTFGGSAIINKQVVRGCHLELTYDSPERTVFHTSPIVDWGVI